jgi:L-ascorbate metabolism protein UlaG (beta-lactamase superfamily)
MEQLPRLTFLGHSTVLIELGGLRILTDPVLFDRIGLLRRVPNSIDADLHARIDVVLLSHLHLDHFDLPSLRLLGPQVRLVVPQGAARLLRGSGFGRVDELAPGERLAIGDLTLTATPAAHGGFRPPWGPRAEAVGYLLEADGTKLYFAGDTDLFAGMADLAPGLDVALLPVWGWGPRLGYGHLDPRGAAEALQLLRPRFAVPIHWGTLWPFGFGRVRPGRLAEPPLEFAAHALQLHPEAQVLVTAPGRVVAFPQPATP